MRTDLQGKYAASQRGAGAENALISGLSRSCRKLGAKQLREDGKLDKRLVGKWTDETSGDVLNIFDETPYRMKMSCPSSGHYNFEPNCVYEKDSDFCFELNDNKFRMIYYLKYQDGCLTGHYTQFGRETAVKFVLSSGTPEDEAYWHEKKVLVPEASESRIELLKKYAGYDREKQVQPFETEYVLGGNTPEMLDNYDYSRYIGDIDPSDDLIAFRLLDWLCFWRLCCGLTALRQGILPVCHMRSRLMIATS